MKPSAHPPAKCTVKEIREGTVNTEIILASPDGREIVAVLTRGSVRGLGLKSALPVEAVGKSRGGRGGVE
jgi:molybdopterin-binding protein